VSDEVELRIAWSSIAPQTARSDEIFDDLVGRHRQPHRRYHGLRHVVWVLRHARRLEAAIPECHDGSAVYDAGVVTAAACFHDAVYDPRAGDNEERSALLAENRLRALDWPAPRCDLVAQLVRATAGYLADDDLAKNDLANDDLAKNVGAGHAAPWEQQVLLDADLAVLGAEPAAYAAYVSGVRSEYGHLSGAEWAAGRSRVLERLLARTSLFATQPATSWWDERARANLVAELASLQGGVRERG
jgi:predicted metal-dependent HD superfamily phosphohydrolase